MLILKMMSGENLADSNNSKGHSITPIADGFTVNFHRNRLTDEGVVEFINNEGEITRSVPVVGNCYLLDNGKTISSFSSFRHFSNNATHDEYANSIAIDDDFIDPNKFFEFLRKEIEEGRADPAAAEYEYEIELIEDVARVLNGICGSDRMLLTAKDNYDSEYDARVGAAVLNEFGFWLCENFGLSFGSLSNGAKTALHDEMVVTGWHVIYSKSGLKQNAVYQDGTPYKSTGDNPVLDTSEAKDSLTPVDPITKHPVDEVN